jgi:outer membrane protein TolC
VSAHAPLCATLALLALGGCALERHVPRPLDAAQVQHDWIVAARVDPADPSLRLALEQAGVDVATWPLPAWDLPALTVLALRRHPELAVARAEAQEALAVRDAAGRRADPGLELALEHHSAPGAVDSPWSLGVALDGLIGGGERRSAQRAQADALADEALLRAALAAWQVRQRVRDAWRELELAQRRQRHADDAAALRADELRLAERRLFRGAGDARALDLARQHNAQAARERAASQAEVVQTRQALAHSLALPLSQFEALALAVPVQDATPSTQVQAIDLQRSMLLDRIELRAQLARYAAADAVLRLEIARQWPELSLKPGFMWDQGDRRWSLGIGFVLPLFERNRGAIAQANARRDTEAARFTALQAQALSDLEAARLATDSAAQQLALAEDQLHASFASETRVERRLEAGDADRSDLLGARELVLQTQGAVIDARGAWLAARARLEDVVQRPLDGNPAGTPPVQIGQR